MELATLNAADRIAVGTALAAQTSWYRALTQHTVLTATACQSLSMRAADVYNFASVHAHELTGEAFANFKALAADMLTSAFGAHAHELTAEESVTLFKFAARAGRGALC